MPATVVATIGFSSERRRRRRRRAGGDAVRRRRRRRRRRLLFLFALTCGGRKRGLKCHSIHLSPLPGWVVPEDRIGGLWEAEKGRRRKKWDPRFGGEDGGPPEMEVEMGTLEEYAK
jgi:hypothetical protein